MEIIRALLVDDNFMIAIVKSIMTEAVEGFQVVKIANSVNKAMDVQ